MKDVCSICAAYSPDVETLAIRYCAICAKPLCKWCDNWFCFREVPKKCSDCTAQKHFAISRNQWEILPF